MSAILTDFGAVTTSVVTQAGSIINFVVGEPLLLIPLAFGFLGAGIATVKRFM